MANVFRHNNLGPILRTVLKPNPRPPTDQQVPFEPQATPCVSLNDWMNLNWWKISLNLSPWNICVTLSPWRLCALAVLLCLKSPQHVDLNPCRAPINKNMVNMASFHSKAMKASLTAATWSLESGFTWPGGKPHKLHFQSVGWLHTALAATTPNTTNSLRSARCSCTRARRRCPEFLGCCWWTSPCWLLIWMNHDEPCKNVQWRYVSRKQTLLWKKNAFRFRRFLEVS